MFEEFEYSDGKIFKNGREIGSRMQTGYWEIYYKGSRYLRHRVVWFMHHGKWPDADIDHIDQDKSNDRIENLRDVDASINLRNQRKIKGYHKCNGRYRAMYSLNNKSVHIGMFDTPEQAREAYLQAIT